MGNSTEKSIKVPPYPPDKLKKAKILCTVSAWLGGLSILSVLLVVLAQQSFMENVDAIYVLRLLAVVLIFMFPFLFVGGVVCAIIALAKYPKTVYPKVLVALYVMAVVIAFATFWIYLGVLSVKTVNGIIDCVNNPPV